MASSLAAFVARREVDGGGGRGCRRRRHTADANASTTAAAAAAGLAATQFRARRALPLWPPPADDDEDDTDDNQENQDPSRLPAAPTAVAALNGLLAVADERGRVGVLSLSPSSCSSSSSSSPWRLRWRAHDNLVFDAAWAQGGRSLLTASADRTVAAWDASTGQRLGTCEGHRGAVKAARAWGGDHHDGSPLAASCGRDGCVLLWDLRVGAARGGGAVGPSSSSPSWSPVGRIDAAHPPPCLAAGAKRRRPRGSAPDPGLVSSLAFLPPSGGGGGGGWSSSSSASAAAPPVLLATAGGADGVVRLWDLRCLSGSSSGSDTSITTTFANRRACLAAVRGAEALPQPWQPAPARPPGSKAARALSCLALSPSGDRLLASSVAGEHFVYDCASLGNPRAGLGAGLIGVLSAPPAAAAAAAVRAAFKDEGGGNNNNLNPPLPAHLRLPFLPRDFCAAVGARACQPQQQGDDDNEDDGASPPRQEAAPLDGTPPLTTPPTAVAAAAASGRSFYVRACWSPDGRCVAAGCPDGALLLFDTAGLAGASAAAAAAAGAGIPPVAVLGAHEGEMTGVAWCDGSFGDTIVTSGDDRRLVVWARDDEALRGRVPLAVMAARPLAAAAAAREPATPLAGAALAASGRPSTAAHRDPATAATATATAGTATALRRRLRQSRIPEALAVAAAAAQRAAAAAEAEAEAEGGRPALPLGRDVVAPPQRWGLLDAAGEASRGGRSHNNNKGSEGALQEEEEQDDDDDDDGRRRRDQGRRQGDEEGDADGDGSGWPQQLRRALTFRLRGRGTATAPSAGPPDTSLAARDVVSDTVADEGAAGDGDEEGGDGDERAGGGGGGAGGGGSALFLSLGDFVPCSLQPFGAQFSQQQQLSRSLQLQQTQQTQRTADGSGGNGADNAAASPSTKRRRHAGGGAAG